MVFALAVVACTGVSKGQPPARRPVVAPPAQAAPLVGRPAPASPVVPPPVVGADGMWARLQAYLPALAGADHEHEFHLVGAFAASTDADTYWRHLAGALDAGHGQLDRTCAGRLGRMLALVIDDPTTTAAIGHADPEVRVFWMPLAHVAGMTAAQAIRAAALVDGPGAAAMARSLRRGRTPAAWIDAVERSQAWFLPAGDDPTIHHRRIRGYAVAELSALRPYLVYIGANLLGGFCEVATVAIERLDGVTVGAIRGGAEALCELAGVRELSECRR